MGHKSHLMRKIFLKHPLPNMHMGQAGSASNTEGKGKMREDTAHQSNVLTGAHHEGFSFFFKTHPMGFPIRSLKDAERSRETQSLHNLNSNSNFKNPEKLQCCSIKILVLLYEMRQNYHRVTADVKKSAKR